MEWINENLCSFDEKVRVEIGPQIIELECCDANLSDHVTAPHYKVGGRDAYGRIIMPERVGEGVDISMGAVLEGEKMAVVDWRCKHAPKVWKVYRAVPHTVKLKGGETEEVQRFEFVSQYESKDKALAEAGKLFEGMQ